MTLAPLCNNKGPSAVGQQKFGTVLTLKYLYGRSSFKVKIHSNIDLVIVFLVSKVDKVSQESGYFIIEPRHCIVIFDKTSNNFLGHPVLQSTCIVYLTFHI